MQLQPIEVMHEIVVILFPSLQPVLYKSVAKSALVIVSSINNG